MSKVDYAKASEVERLINLNDSGKEFITRLRYIKPEITIEQIWDDLQNFQSCTMVDNHELKILTEAKAILKHEAKTMQMIANL